MRTILWTIEACEEYIAILEMCRTIWQMARRLVNVVSIHHLMGQSFLFEQKSKCYPTSSKDQGRVHQFGTKVLPGTFMGYAMNTGGSWTGDMWIADTADLKTMPPSEIHLKNIQIKRGGHGKERKEMCIPMQDGDILQESRYPPLCTKREATSGKNVNRSPHFEVLLEHEGELQKSESCCSKNETLCSE